ncbi:hypothetical protein V8E36_009569 [Tilletia maclaganii]
MQRSASRIAASLASSSSSSTAASISIAGAGVSASISPAYGLQHHQHRPSAADAGRRRYSCTPSTQSSLQPASSSSSSSSQSTNDFFTSSRFPNSSSHQSSSRHLNIDADEDHGNNDHHQPQQPPSRLSEHEYQVRIGRAIQLLRNTLPDFMNIGLADYPEPTTPKILPLDPLALVRLAPTLRRSRRPHYLEHLDDDQSLGSVYHPDVLFEFMPSLAPTASEDAETSSHAINDSASASAAGPSSSKLPSQSAISQDELEGKPSFSFSGRTLYLASAQVLRHALSAIFTNPQVSLDRLHLVRGSRSRAEASGAEGGGRTSSWDDDSPPAFPGSTGADADGGGGGGGCAVDDELIARLTFSGETRVMHQPHEYTVLFRYTLDRATGQIVRHRVERIQPEVGRSLWTGLSLAWFRLAPHMYPGSVVHSHQHFLLPPDDSLHSTLHHKISAAQQQLRQPSFRVRVARPARDTATMQHEGVVAVETVPVAALAQRRGARLGLQRRESRSM